MTDEAWEILIEEFIVSVTAKITQRQVMVDTWLLSNSTQLTRDELFSIASELEVIRAELEGMVNSISSSIKESVVSSAQSGRSDQQSQDPEKEYRWQVESGNPCPDCISRDGEIATYEEWENVGLPRSGITICGHNCKCVLVGLDSEKG